MSGCEECAFWRTLVIVGLVFVAAVVLGASLMAGDRRVACGALLNDQAVKAAPSFGLVRVVCSSYLDAK